MAYVNKLRCIFIVAALASLLAMPVSARTMSVFCFSRSDLQTVVGDYKARLLRERYNYRFICGAAACHLFQQSRNVYRQRCKLLFVSGLD